MSRGVDCTESGDFRFGKTNDENGCPISSHWKRGGNVGRTLIGTPTHPGDYVMSGRRKEGWGDAVSKCGVGMNETIPSTAEKRRCDRDTPGCFPVLPPNHPPSLIHPRSVIRVEARTLKNEKTIFFLWRLYNEKTRKCTNRAPRPYHNLPPQNPPHPLFPLSSPPPTLQCAF